MFDDSRYFDVFVEYAKDSAEDLLIQITVHNRGPERADIHVLPTLWFRNQWSWQSGVAKPTIELEVQRAGGASIARAVDAQLGERFLCCENDAPLLFTENETNTQRIFGVASRTPYVKDGINNRVVNDAADAVNPEKQGTKVAAHYQLTIEPGQSQVVRLRLSDVKPVVDANGRKDVLFGTRFDEILQARKNEADQFYATVIPASLDADAKNVMRQALAGMLWSKQFYYYDVDKWLEERGSDPFKPLHQVGPRNDGWHHVQQRRDLDAGQVGVPLVCRLGPGVSCARTDACRS